MSVNESFIQNIKSNIDNNITMLKKHNNQLIKNNLLSQTYIDKNNTKLSNILILLK